MVGYWTTREIIERGGFLFLSDKKRFKQDYQRAVFGANRQSALDPQVYFALTMLSKGYLWRYGKPYQQPFDAKEEKDILDKFV